MRLPLRRTLPFSRHLDYPRVSTILAGRKVANAEPTGAAVLVADKLGCLMQLQGVLHAQASPLRVLHLAQLIDERLQELNPQA